MARKARRATPKRGKARKGVGGPFVTAALLCEKILSEGAVSSLIRVVDTFYFDVEELATLERSRVALHAHLYITVKSGDAKGKKLLKIKPVTPTGQVLPEMSSDIVLPGGAGGANLQAQLAILLTEEGVHWIEIYVDGRLMTKTPFHVIFRKKPESTTESTPAAKKRKR